MNPSIIESIDGGARVEARGDLYHGIPCRIIVGRDGREGASREVAADAWRILERIDDVFNVYRADSELGAINAGGRGTYQLSPWLSDCLRIARQVEALSGGAWCATMLPLVRLWRQAAREGADPSEAALADARAACAPEAWSLDGSTLRVTDPRVAFDLGGLAKGFAVDLVVELLWSQGVEDLLVQVGGETACHGHTSDGGRHRIGIPHPDDPDGAWCAVLCDPGAGLCGSTSGDYRQPLVVAGRARHHVIDPRSGQPAESLLASVTCAFTSLGSNALADGLSTAAAVLGPNALASFRAATGCTGSCLRRDPQRGMVEARVTGWTELIAPDG